MSLTALTALSGHTEARLWYCAWSPCGKYFATTGEDRTIRIWSMTRFDAEGCIPCIAVLEEGQSKTIRCCEWSPDGKMIASASFDGKVVIWERQASSMTVWDMVACLEGHESEVKCLSWSYDNRWLATCGRDKSIWIWENMDNGDFECATMLQQHTQDVKCVTFHPSRNVLFSGSYDDTIRVWAEDGDDWYCVDTLAGHTSTVWGLTVCGERFVSCGDDLSVKLWQSQGPQASAKWMLLSSIEQAAAFPIYSVHWSAVHGMVASGSGDNSISLYSITSGLEGGIRLESKLSDAHENDVNCVRYIYLRVDANNFYRWNPSSALGYVLLSVGDDGLVRLWRLDL